MASSVNYPVLIEGHPGVGKTTFMKKIAYDWATHTAATEQFALVLIVPLRDRERTIFGS